MKEDYGLSVSTLREILNRLASEGFVVAEGQRGFEVAPVSIQNLRELAQLRILLEHHAMTDSFRAGDMEWEGRVVSPITSWRSPNAPSSPRATIPNYANATTANSIKP